MSANTVVTGTEEERWKLKGYVESSYVLPGNPENST